MSEPTVQELIDRVEAAEARAASAEALAAAAVKAGGDTVSRVESKLIPQEELDRGYAASRKRSQDVMRTSMTDKRFRNEARGESPGEGLPSSDALRQIVREELARLIAEETAPTKPATASTKDNPRK